MTFIILFRNNLQLKNSSLKVEHLFMSSVIMAQEVTVERITHRVNLVGR